MFDLDKAQRLSLTVQVESRLKSALILGLLKPGARLVTKEIAQQLGTSITPVREALLRLVASGALEVTPAQAFLVPAMSIDRYQEISTIRKALEGMAVQKAVNQIAATDLQHLSQLKDIYIEAKNMGTEAILKANREFYFQLYHYAAMPALTELIEQIWIRMGPGFNFLYTLPAQASQENHSYDALLESITIGDAERSVAIIHQSIERDLNILTQQSVA